ncbi:MAG: cytochrome C oxidase subunit IV family protein [Longimicrobiales bacterium]
MHNHDNDDMPVHSGEVEHASVRTYVIVGIILTAITGVEVAIFYIDAMQGILIPVLMVLSVVKFVTVVQFFMHLRYDNKVLSRVFFGPLMLAILVVVAMILLFKWLPKFAW